MELFRQGKVKVLTCTDAAGMGCNIPDIDVVVQWKSTNSVETFHQRGGRAARDKSRKGIAVLLAEPNAYKVDPTEPASATKPNTQAKRRTYTGRKSRGTKKKSSTPTSGEIEIHDDSPGSGIYAFIQTTTCRREILTRVFKNPAPAPTPGVPCCDICDPSVLDQVSVPPPEKKRRVIQAKKGCINTEVVDSLTAWREKICKRDYSHLQWAPNAFLDDQTIHSIASRPTVATGNKLAMLLKGEWGYWNRHGEELLIHLTQALAKKVSASNLLVELQIGEDATQGPGTENMTRTQERSPKKKHNMCTVPERKGQASGSKNVTRDLQVIPNSKPSVSFNTGLIRLPPASPRSQWRVSTTPMLPPEMTPVVPSQKRVGSPDPDQSRPHKLRVD